MNFSSDNDQKTYASFASLAKNGFAWKSPAQRAFWLKHDNLLVSAPANDLAQAIHAQQGQYVLQLDAYYVWSELKGRGVVPVIVAIVFDDNGLVSISKVGGRGNLRDGWAPDYNKVKKTHERPIDFVAPVWEMTASESIAKQLSQPVGAVGDKVEVQGVVVFQNSYYTTINYTNVASYFVLIAGTDGNIYQYKGSKFFDKGQQVHFKATVKEHKPGKLIGETVTVIKAPKPVLA